MKEIPTVFSRGGGQPSNVALLLSPTRQQLLPPSRPALPTRQVCRAVDNSDSADGHFVFILLIFTASRRATINISNLNGGNKLRTIKYMDPRSHKHEHS